MSYLLSKLGLMSTRNNFSSSLMDFVLQALHYRVTHHPEADLTLGQPSTDINFYSCSCKLYSITHGQLSHHHLSTPVIQTMFHHILVSMLIWSYSALRQGIRKVHIMEHLEATAFSIQNMNCRQLRAESRVALFCLIWSWRRC